MSATAPTFEDCLPLARLYARFDAIAEGLTHGDSSAAHRAVLDRLAANRRTAEDLGWTACALERQGGGGRLLLSGVRQTGLAREVVPDWIPRWSETTTLEALRRIERSPNERKQERYRLLEVLIRERLVAASPPVTTGAFERLARRLVAAAYKQAPPPGSAPASGGNGSDPTPAATETGDDTRRRDASGTVGA